MSVPAVQKHVAVLEEAGLVTKQRRGRESLVTGDIEAEIRQVFEAEDFGAALTPELQAQEERLRAQAGERAKAAKQ